MNQSGAEGFGGRLGLEASVPWSGGRGLLLLFVALPADATPSAVARALRRLPSDL